MKPRLFTRLIVTLFVIGGIAGLFGCHASPAKKANTNFFTSGSREVDQRAYNLFVAKLVEHEPSLADALKPAE